MPGCGGVGERGGQNMWNSPAEKTCEKKLALKVEQMSDHWFCFSSLFIAKNISGRTAS